jgi:hypothetical protein
MIQKVVALGAVVLLIAGSAFAAPDKTKKPAPKKPAPKFKLVVITTCPTTGEDAPTDAGGSSIVGKYKVNFCCAGCKPAFDMLSKEEKAEKLAELAKKQAAKKS